MNYSQDPMLVALLRTAHRLEARLEQALDEVGLSIAKHGVLAQLAAAGEPLPLSDLAARQSCVRSNMTQLIDRLEADGLVRRVDDPDDRRSVRATLTPHGKEQYAAGEQAVHTVQVAFAAALPDTDRRALARALSALA